MEDLNKCYDSLVLNNTIVQIFMIKSCILSIYLESVMFLPVSETVALFMVLKILDGAGLNLSRENSRYWGPCKDKGQPKDFFLPEFKFCVKWYTKCIRISLTSTKTNQPTYKFVRQEQGSYGSLIWYYLFEKMSVVQGLVEQVGLGWVENQHTVFVARVPIQD